MAGIFAQQILVDGDAKKRVEERLARIEEIESKRPCKKCFYYNPARIIRCTCGRKCNFEHDQFSPGAGYPDI